jgi:hypothetical protein
MAQDVEVRTERAGRAPGACPACAGPLLITRLQCPDCGTEVAGVFAADRLVNLPEPHASLLELFLRVRGNVKEMERELRLSYPTVRARLEEALTAARAKLPPAARPPVPPASPPDQTAAARGVVLDALERGEISAQEAARRLRRLRDGPDGPPEEDPLPPDRPDPATGGRDPR